MKNVHLILIEYFEQFLLLRVFHEKRTSDFGRIFRTIFIVRGRSQKVFWRLWIMLQCNTVLLQHPVLLVCYAP